LQRHWRDGVFQALSLKHFAFTYFCLKISTFCTKRLRCHEACSVYFASEKRKRTFEQYELQLALFSTQTTNKLTNPLLVASLTAIEYLFYVISFPW